MNSNDLSDNKKTQEHQLELGEDVGTIALRKAWEHTLRSQASDFYQGTFESFLRPLKPLSLDGDIAVFGAISSFGRDWVEKKFAPSLLASLRQQLNLPGLKTRFITIGPDTQQLLGSKPLPLQIASSNAHYQCTAALPFRSALATTPIQQASPRPADSRNPYLCEMMAPLNPKYTFENLVIGKSNEFACSVARDVTAQPGVKYNPFYIYGNPGLGKTHLAHAICHQIRSNLPNAQVAYVNGETFTNHYVSSIRDKRSEDFRRAYRNVDVWLVDDIQSFATKEQTREEFFNTLNSLLMLNRQVIVTSDRKPKDFRTMDDRLKSRLVQGVVADISPPDLEMRQAILQQKAVNGDFKISAEVIAFMADLIQSNIRALEGALVRLMAYASVDRRPVTKDLALKVLGDYFVERLPSVKPALQSGHPEDYTNNSYKTAPTIDQVIHAISAKMDIEGGQILLGKSRRSHSNNFNADPGLARQVAMSLVKELCNIPIAEIAVAFGCKHTSAISHAHTRLQGELRTNLETAALIASIRTMLENT